MAGIISDLGPFKMYGNLYFIGEKRVSVHLIETSEGLVLIDSGYPDMYEQIKTSMKKLGFDIKDVCAVFLSHGHFDHTGTALKIREETNAKLYIGRPDNDIVNGKRNLSWADEAKIPPLKEFDCDVLVDDGDTFTFGDTTIRCVSSPGHTEGVISFFVNIKGEAGEVIAAMHGGVGMNSMKKEYLLKKGLPLTLRDEFLQGLQKLSKEKVDIVMGNHPEPNDTEGKLKKVMKSESIIDPNEWKQFLIVQEKNVNKLIKEEGN